MGQLLMADLIEYDNPLVTTYPEKDALLIECINKWMAESDRVYSQKRKRMRLNEDLYNNEMKLSTGTDVTNIKVALAFATIESIMPIIEDYLPTFDIMPQDKDDEAWADMVQKRKAQIEEQANLKFKLLECIHDALEYCNGLLQLNIKYDKDGNFAGFTFSVVDLFGWFPSPGATGLDIRSEADYHVFVYPMNVGRIKRELGITVTPEGDLSEYMTFRVTEGGEKTGINTESELALVKEAYWMDPDTTNYPYGRMVIGAGTQIAVDKPLWEGARELGIEDESVLTIPYAMIGNYKPAHGIYGIGEPELNKSLLKALNETMSSISEQVKKTGFPVRKITKSLYAELGKLVGMKAGEPVVVNNPNDFTTEMPPSLQAGITQFIDIILRMMEYVNGMQEVSRGSTPTGVTAAQAIAALQEAAQSRIRYRINKDISEFVLRIGKYISFCIQQYDTKARVLKAQIEGQAQYQQYAPQTRMDANKVYEGQEGFDETTAKTLAESSFDVAVVTGSRVPGGRMYREERAMSMYEKQIIGIETLLDRMNEPDKAALIKDYYKRMGIEEQVQRSQQIQETYPEFQKLCAMAAQSPEWAGSGEESQLKEITQQFPELMQSEDWQMIPVELRQRLTAWLYTDDSQQQPVAS